MNRYFHRLLICAMLLGVALAPASMLAAHWQAPAAATTETQAWSPVSEDWLTLEIAGGRAGWTSGGDRPRRRGAAHR